MDHLLKKHNLALNNLSFIAVNQGPGPFTTLRVVIASVNGLSFATGIPLIGIDGFDALIHEHQDNRFPHTLYLMNAFNQDVYVALTDHNKIVYQGYSPITSLLERITHEYPHQTIRCIGNGAELYRTRIQEYLGNYAYIPEPLALTPSIEHIGILGLKIWQQGQKGTHQLLPLYLKSFPIS